MVERAVRDVLDDHLAGVELLGGCLGGVLCGVFLQASWLNIGHATSIDGAGAAQTGGAGQRLGQVQRDEVAP